MKKKSFITLIQVPDHFLLLYSYARISGRLGPPLTAEVLFGVLKHFV
jgi:hypothetical protein